MRHMSQDKARFFVSDLLTVRAPPIKRLRSGKAVLTRYRGLKDEMEGTAPEPPEVPVGERVDRQIAAGQSLRSLLDAYAQPPLGTGEHSEAGARLRAEILDAQREAGSGAADRAIFTEALIGRREVLEADLAVFEDTPVPGVVEAWLEAGVSIKEAMAANTSQPARSGRSMREIVADVRRTTVSLRQLIRAELAFNPELPSNLEELILGLADATQRKPRRRAAETDPVEAIEPEDVEVEHEVNALDTASPAPIPLPHAVED